MTLHTIFQPAVAVFVCGLALLWLAGAALRLAQSSRNSSWGWLALFGSLQGLAQWSPLAVRSESAALLAYLSLLLSAISYFALLEFGRSEIKHRGRRLLKPWIYGVVVALVVVILAINGQSGLGAAVRYGLAIPGSIAATIAMGQMARERRAGWPLALASAAIAVFVLGDAMSIAALRAFAAMALLTGVWVESRALCPLPSSAGLVQRWRSPVGFAIILIAGAAGVAAFAESSDADSAVALVAANSESDSNADSAAPLIAPVEVDSRTLARQRADALRYKQGLTLLGALGVIAVVWLCLARFAAAK